MMNVIPYCNDQASARYYARVALDYRLKYRQIFGHDAPASCGDWDVVKLYDAARLNDRNYSDAMRQDEVLLKMLYWRNPATSYSVK